MPALVLQRREEQQNIEGLKVQLQAALEECDSIQSTYLNKLERFMIENSIWDISELDYEWRVAYEDFLQGEMKPTSFASYLKVFDRVKRYSMKNDIRLTIQGKEVIPPYENRVLFLPYHPIEEIAAQFEQAFRKKDWLWDFTKKAPEHMKRQIYSLLHDIIENVPFKSQTVFLSGLRELYRYCEEEQIEDIELLELEQIEKFAEYPSELTSPQIRIRTINYCRKALFIQAEKINWNAHVWYMERLQIQPERLDTACPVQTMSFVELTHHKNREILKKYIRYGLGVTNISLSVIRSELYLVRNFLVGLNQAEHEDVCSATSEQIDAYFKQQQRKDVQAETYNKIIMAVQHFFNFLLVRKYIERIPFDPDCYVKKSFRQHIDRSITQQVSDEILEKLYAFPETTRLMYLHLYCIGLRVSEVCTLKGDAYYIQGEDAWIQVYQIKMRTYKRIPIPDALYKLMKVYMKRHDIKADDYVFQNTKGGAYRVGTFRYNMLKHCELNQIQNGEYIFRSHDYRHTIATYFYDTGVSLQSVRDYLGHTYEEMTEQYIDYMPKKIEKASEEYFGGNSLLAAMKGGKKADG